MNQHNQHATDYKVLESDCAEALAAEVTHAIHSGWQPFGGMKAVVTSDGPRGRLRLFQPIVKHAEWYR